jgi:hypothetical protein
MILRTMHAQQKKKRQSTGMEKRKWRLELLGKI